MTISRWHSSTPRDRSCDHVHPLAPRPHGHEHAKKRMQRARSKRPMSGSVVGGNMSVPPGSTIALRFEGSNGWGVAAACKCGFHVCAKRGPCAPQAAPAPATPAPRFKRGDRVRVTRGDTHLRGECVSNQAGDSVNVRFDGQDCITQCSVVPLALEPLAPAKPEAVRRWSGGEVACVGDVVAGASNTPRTVVALHADGRFDAQAHDTDRVVTLRSTSLHKLLSRAPAAAGADGNGRAREVGGG